MHTETTSAFPGEIRGGDEAEHRLRIARVLLERAADDLEEIARNASRRTMAGAHDETGAELTEKSVEMNLLLAIDQLQPVTFM